MTNLSLTRESHWTDEQRQAALAELERRYQTRLTEQEVFQAAALFFGLLKEGVFIDKTSVAQRMQQESARAEALVDEIKRRDA